MLGKIIEINFPLKAFEKNYDFRTFFNVIAT